MNNKSKIDAQRWLETAKEDLEAANIMLKNNMFAHACFHSQQSAEKSMKALHIFLDGDPWGHSILKLISELKEVSISKYNYFEQYQNQARVLDRFYIPTRYPDGLPDLTPSQVFVIEDATVAIENANLFWNEVAMKINMN